MIMKKLFVASMLVGFSYPIVSAQEPVKDSTVVITPAPAKDGFTQTNVETLPQQVLIFLEKTYPGALIKEAFVLTKDSSEIYNVVVLTKEGKEVSSTLNAKGEIIN